MTTTEPTTPKPRRRWLQFSLRTMLVLVLLLGVGFGWFAREVQKARAQREAAKAIEKLGGSVDWGLPSAGMIRTAVAGVGKLFGEDLSGDTTMVVLVGSLDTDAGLALLQGLRQLRQLYVTGSQVSDAGLTHLRGLTQLGWLGLSSSQVTDAGLVHQWRQTNNRKEKLTWVRSAARRSRSRYARALNW